MTRMSAEMKTPARRSGDWEGFSPQRPEPYASKPGQEYQQVLDPQALQRKETPSGIQGLTYDQAGRPV